MEYANITVETRENLGIITLNRPQALNAVNAEMLKELALAAEAFDNNDAVRVLIVKGDGKTFAAGIDIKEVLSRADSKFLGIDEMQNCFRRFAAVKKPIIAAVSGYYFGCGQRKVRPAGTQSGHNSGIRRHTASDPRARQSQGDGNDFKRPGLDGGRGFCFRTRQPDCAAARFV